MLLRTLQSTQRAFSTGVSYFLPPRIFKSSVSRLDAKNHKLTVNASNIRCEIPFKSTDLLGDIKGRLTEETGSRNVRFINQDNIEIANNTKYGDIELEQLYFIIDDAWAFEIVNCERSNFLREDSVTAADLSANELEDLKFPFLYQNEMLNYYKRLDMNKLESGVFEDIIREVINKILDHRITPVPLLSQLEDEYATLVKEYLEMKEKRQILRSRAEKIAKRLFALGILIFGLQSFVVIYGVYYIYSWDIMEPIVFFWQFAGGLILATTFFSLRAKYDYGKLLNMVARRIEHRSYAKRGFDISEYNRVKTMIRQNRKDQLKNLIGEF